jgi:hypothetical protein
MKTQIHIATRVCTAIERGDLDQKFEVGTEGEMVQLKCMQLYFFLPIAVLAKSNHVVISVALNGLLDYSPSILSEVSRVFLETKVEGHDHQRQAVNPTIQSRSL